MEEEISLRELIETVLKGKHLIAAVTAMAVFISGVFSFFVLSPVYEARATLMVNIPTVQNREVDSALKALLDNLSRFPTMSMETYRTQVTNHQVLQRVIDELNLDDTTVTDLANRIQVSSVRDTNLINIIVKDSDPVEAASTANVIAHEFINFINEQNREKLRRSVVFLQSQMLVEEQKLNDAVEEYKVFIAQSPGVEELRGDIESHLELLTQFKLQRVQSQLALEQAYASLNRAEQQLASTPKLITVSKSVVNDPLMSELVRENMDQTTAGLSGMRLESEELNPTYIFLTEIIANQGIESSRLEKELAGLDREIANISERLERIQVKFAHKKTEYDTLSQKVSSARFSYESFFNKYEETRITEAAELGETNIFIAAEATVPETKVAPKRALNLAIGAVLGLMLGTFWALFREYWRTSGLEQKKYS